MEALADKIARLDTEIQALKEDLRSATTTKEKVAIRNQLDTKEKRLFWLEQQGKFSSLISVVFSHSYR